STRLSTALVGNGISVKDEHLLMACRKGNEKLALELLKRSNQGGINFVDQQGNTSLHWACNQGLGTLAMELIKQGASIDAVNKKGDTPIQEAIRNEVGSVSEYATNQGVDVSSLRWETELKDISQLSAGLAKR